MARTASKSPPRLTSAGLEIGKELVPLYAGAFHYWRNDPVRWRACLSALRAIGLRLVDLYVPWSVHEPRRGQYEFGESDPRCDLAQVLSLARELGLWVILRPGPHINAEMTRFGIPEWIVWRRSCQARTPKGNPVVLPVPPLAFPVPSYASRTFLEQASSYLHAVGKVAQPFVHPDGPIVLVQVDNEAALYFRDAAYDQDYHPDAISQYRRFLKKKHGRQASPRSVYGIDLDSFDELVAPDHFDAKSIDELGRHLDWAEFQETMIATFLRAVARRIDRVGFADVPTVHNIPMAEHTTALNTKAIQDVVSLVGLDYYFQASEGSRKAIARRTSELVVRCDARDHPPFACEQGAGFPPFMAPMVLRDNAFAVMTELAYGLRGFNLYMAVGRDRWIGSPIDQDGQRQPSADFWEQLIGMLERTSFRQLRRRTPVRIVISRAQLRLERVMHAFGPVSGAAFAVMGGGARQRCFEDDFGTGESLALSGEAFVDTLEQVLEARGVPFAVGFDDDPEAMIRDAKWVIAVTPAGSVSEPMREALGEFGRRGGCVTFGPNPPTHDARLCPQSPVPDAIARSSVVPDVVGSARPKIEAVVGRAIEALHLPVFERAPLEVHVTCHEDEGGKPRLAFLINPTPEVVHVRLRLPESAEVGDAMQGGTYPVEQGVVRLPIPAKTVRVLELK